MSRFLNPGERAMLASGAGHWTRARIRVTNFNGDWIDLGALSAGARTLRMFNSAQLSDHIDWNTHTLSAVVKREAGAAYSLSPFRSDSVLNDAGDGTFSPVLDLHRQWAVDAVFVARGVTPTLPDDYRPMAEGYIDRLDISGSQNTITIAGRGKEADLIERRILFVDPTADPRVAISKATPKTYAGGEIADVLQAILDEELGVGVVPLTLASSAPAYYVEGWEQLESVGLFDLLTQIAALPGANLRYLYDADDNLTLTLFTPRRQATEGDVDWEIGGREYQLLDASLDIDPVRNFIIVKYMSAAGVLTATAPALPESASIERYGLRPLEIDLSADTKVNDVTGAQPLADAVLADWELPPLEQQLTAPGLWFLSLHDYARTVANGVLYDQDQYGAVMGYTHTFANGRLSTQAQLSGKPKGRYATWLQYGGAPAVAVAPMIASLELTFYEADVVADSPPGLSLSLVYGQNCKSAVVEYGLDPTFAVNLYTINYDLATTGPTPTTAFSFMNDDQRDLVYYARATPYSGPIVSGLPTGTAGIPAIVSTLSLKRPTDSATVAFDFSVPGQMRANVIGAGIAAPGFVALTDGATITWATGGARENNALVTIAGNRTLSITGAVDGAEGYLEVTQDATGGRTLTLPAGTIVGATTSISTVANKKTAIAWSYNGSSFTFVLAREA